jgi:hypothetical protein
MASSREQELAKDMVVAWLNYIAAAKISAPDLTTAPKAAETIAGMYQVMVRAVEETTTPPPNVPPAI